MEKSVAFICIISFLIAIVVGALLLMLPISTKSGHIAVENAFFTSSSAVTVTGLSVVDTGTYFTFFGQMVILLLLQFGGLGFMTFSTLIILLIGKSISIADTYIIESDFTTGDSTNIRGLIKKIFLMTLTFEFVGAISFYFQFTHLDAGKRVFSAIFHSISAFCNAGFSLFSNSFENYTSHWGINITLAGLIIAGGIGFIVLNEAHLFIKRKIKSPAKFSLHTKLVCIVSLILIFVGALFIYFEESVHQSENISVGTRMLSAIFQSVTARTAGFNTLDLKLLSYASMFIILLLMFVGASPGSTGGGVKTSSFGIVLAYLRAQFKGREKVDLFFRNIPDSNIEKAFIIIILALVFISISFVMLLTFEKNLGVHQLLFETISAFGTVGLSLGITAKLSLASKIIIMATMFIGRIGPFTLFIALSRKKTKAVFSYPEEKIMIG